jgi:orotidine-5'-phosphate decarboxylase
MKPIIALDFPDLKRTKAFLDQFETESLYVKVGMELFYQTGPAVIEAIKEKGHQLFLDLKLHDIPNTVYQAMKGLAGLEVDMVNVHAAGGRNMMTSALEGLEAGTPAGRNRANLIAVTQLTSVSERDMQRDQLIPVSLEESVLHYARQSFESGLDGVVCSAFEAGKVSEVTRGDFIKVTPGIRLHGDAQDDQKRVMTPEQAFLMGSTAIVVGRSITKANDSVAAYYKVKEAWEGN